MSKKSLTIIILSVAIWIGSGIIQFMVSFNPYLSCTLTGFPIALCLNSESRLKIISIYIANIAFWFMLIWGILALIKRVQKK